MYAERWLRKNIEFALETMPVVAILGPRQCGKTTLAKRLMEAIPERRPLWLDLELPSDRAKLGDPETFLTAHADRLVCLDEIQRVPELFPVLRGLVDQQRHPGRFLVLGSASRDLIRQTSESLAGRIRYLELTPLLSWENPGDSLQDYWLRGGFPGSLLAPSAEASFEWRLDFVRSFLERDVPDLAPRLSTATLRRLWQMLAHLHGQLLNMAQLSNALDVSAHTVRHHIDLLEGAFMARRLQPYHMNIGKRLVKSPKLYLRDSGILHNLLGIRDVDSLMGHPVVGASWEGLVIENICARLRRGVEVFFYRTARGAEVDLVLEAAGQKVLVEIKSSVAPKPRPGFWSAIGDLGSTRNWIIAPVRESFPMGLATVSSLQDFLDAPANRDILDTVSPTP